MTPEEKKSLKEKIKLEKERRSKAKALEEAQFSIDIKEVIKETEEISTLVSQITKEHGAHYKVIKMAEEMGMELRTINEDGDHAYLYGPYILLINKDKKTFNFNEVYDDGTSFSMYVRIIKKENLAKIRKDFEYALFLKDGEPLKKMIKKDRVAWERLYKEQLGPWK